MKLSGWESHSINECSLGINEMGHTDGVNTSGTAGVTASGAARCGGSLIGSVIDGVTGGSATSLECVVETDPVTGFVSESLDQRPLVCGMRSQ